MALFVLDRRRLVQGAVCTASVALGVANVVAGQDADEVQEKPTISGREARQDVEQLAAEILDEIAQSRDVQVGEREKEEIAATSWEELKPLLAKYYIIVDP